MRSMAHNASEDEGQDKVGNRILFTLLYYSNIELILEIACGSFRIDPGSCQIPVNQAQFSSANCPWFPLAYFKALSHRPMWKGFRVTLSRLSYMVCSYSIPTTSLASESLQTDRATQPLIISSLIFTLIKAYRL